MPIPMAMPEMTNRTASRKLSDEAVILKSSLLCLLALCMEGRILSLLPGFVSLFSHAVEFSSRLRRHGGPGGVGRPAHGQRRSKGLVGVDVGLFGTGADRVEEAADEA